MQALKTIGKISHCNWPHDFPKIKVCLDDAYQGKVKKAMIIAWNRKSV